MLKIYVMPDGVKRQYREGEQPAGAVPFVPKSEAKQAKPAHKPSKRKA